MPQKVQKSEQEWQQQLTPQQYEVLRLKGTEPPFTGKYARSKDKGVFRCAGCGAPLFDSKTKFESGTGWPSFYEPIAQDAIHEQVDHSYGMTRVELECASCGGHLGHVFEDGPDPTGLRYCINSASIDLEPAKE